VRRFALACVIAGVLAGSAVAADIAPFDLYKAGRYEDAIKAGEAVNTGESLAVSARAAFAEANLSETPCLPCLQRVESYARRSIALDTTHPEAYVYLAAALGYQARIVGTITAQLRHYPEDAKEAIDHALAVAPNDDWALAAAGAWHIEVVRNGGALLARTIYGARVETGKEFFYKAFAAEPKNLVIRFQYVLSLSGYDFDGNSDAVAAVLDSIRTMEPRTVYEGVIKQRAQRLLDLIKANKRAEFLTQVSRYQGYPS
jgi:hypothetical protein